MSTTDLLPPRAKAPPEIAVPVVQFSTLGLIKVVERAIRAHGPVVTLLLPGDRRMTVLGRAAHAALWQKKNTSETRWKHIFAFTKRKLSNSDSQGK